MTPHTHTFSPNGRHSHPHGYNTNGHHHHDHRPQQHYATNGAYTHSHAANGHHAHRRPPSTTHRLTARFGIDETNLAWRRQFIRLGEEERTLLTDLIPWIEEHAPRIAKDFYDWQFNFPRTVEFFEHYAGKQGMTLAHLRQHLEKAQTHYLISCFKGAENHWGVSYFENRLKVGQVHDRINLPFKWYVGGYIEFYQLLRTYLHSSFEDRTYVDQVFFAMLKVFNLDLQAIGDSFILNTIDALGFSVESVQTSEATDRTEHLEQIKALLTERKLQNADYQGQIEAIGKAQAVIEFNLDGTIRTANENFLTLMGYRLDEIQGQHHSLFLTADQRASREYQQFWERLNRGDHQGGEVKRIGKQGKEIWIQASYNPILDHNSKPFKVVKYATDVTDQVEAKATLENAMSSLLANAQELASTSEQMTTVGQTLGTNAAETSSKANIVATAAGQVNQSMQTVATGAEEMTASIREVAGNAQQAARIATDAVAAAERTNVTVAKLGESSTEIGKVIKVITSIAQQTNLLALNATIEAARAGEAGKGFAVVANEVKELAKQTAQATEDIGQKIEAIQTDTKEAVVAIDQISSIIGQINDIQGMIAGAVEEQTATTSEIARYVAEAAMGSGEIAENIADVAEAADSTSAGVSESQRTASELTRMAGDLQAIVEQFQ